ncbi:STAS domain-containing protein [Aquihabitans sp. McL0605]|uniref:STAS domain-containing protein n=1 Tax=Aquihabitans sp. McL0605 TaxID=3415671 RepID=UPI003CF07E16
MPGSRDLFYVQCSEAPGWVVLHAVGELDVSSGSLLADAVEAAMHASGGQVLLDLSRLTFCDGYGLSQIVRLRRESTAADRTLQVSGATGSFLRLVDLTGLTGALYAPEDLLREPPVTPVRGAPERR